MYMVPELIAAREIFCGQQAQYPFGYGSKYDTPKIAKTFGYLWISLVPWAFNLRYWPHDMSIYIYIQLYTHSYHRWLFHISPIFIISRPCIILYLRPFLDPFVAKIAACGVTFGRKLEELEAVDPVRTALVKGEIRENTHGWYNMI